jgi:hypothetical protein
MEPNSGGERGGADDECPVCPLRVPPRGKLGCLLCFPQLTAPVVVVVVEEDWWWWIRRGEARRSGLETGWIGARGTILNTGVNIMQADAEAVRTSINTIRSDL